jgi:succinate-acetate transporter protein
MTALGNEPWLSEGPLEHLWTKAGPVVTHLSEPRVHEVQEVSEASVGEPGPMALFGFAVGTLLIALPITGEVPTATAMAAVPALLVFAGLGQFIGGLVAYRKGNTFAATAFCSFGANNVVVSTFLLFQAIGLIPSNNNTSLLLAIDLFCFAYIAFVLFLAAFKLNAAFVLVLLALFPGYGLSAVGYLSSQPAVIAQIGGWFLVASAGLAFYAGGALAVNSTYERTILPMFPRAGHPSTVPHRPQANPSSSSNGARA